jgi:hypothetical protein
VSENVVHPMSAEAVASGVVWLAAAYLGAGLLFGVFFLARGIERLDPAARGSSLGFRLIVLPGVVALWPLLAKRWLTGAAGPPVERNAHRRAAAHPRPKSAR